MAPTLTRVDVADEAALGRHRARGRIVCRVWQCVRTTHGHTERVAQCSRRVVRRQRVVALRRGVVAWAGRASTWWCGGVEVWLHHARMQLQPAVRERSLLLRGRKRVVQRQAAGRRRQHAWVRAGRRACGADVGSIKQRADEGRQGNNEAMRGFEPAAMQAGEIGVCEYSGEDEGCSHAAWKGG